MKRIKLFTALMLSLVMIFTAFPVFASTETETAADSSDYESGQLIVLVDNTTDKSRVQEMAEEAGGKLVRMSALGDGTNVALIKVNDGSETKAISTLSAMDDVIFVQPNYKYELNAYPNDPEYVDGRQDYLRKDPKLDEKNAGSINAAGAWKQLGNTSLPDEDKILVGVIDTGANLKHVDLQGCIVKDKCVTFNDGKKQGFRAGDNSDDDIGHGSNVTGVIAADINNGIGVAGVAGGRAKVIVVDAGSVRGGIDSFDIAMGIYYLTDEGVRVINMSVGSRARDWMYERAVKYAWDKGTICICSAGNDGSAHLNTPGDSPYAVSVMAHEWEGDPASFSCYGVERDISAPGSILLTTGHLRKTSYSIFDGTSAAAPVAVGAAALLLSADPSLTPREIKNLLYTSSGKESFSAEKEGQGFGRLNLDTAMRNLLSTKTAPKKLVINKTDINMFEGSDTSIEYAVYPGNTNTVDVSFSSSNTKVVTVNEDGILEAKAPGKARITVSCKGLSAVCNVTVMEAPYITINRKPFKTTGEVTMDALMDIIISAGGTNDAVPLVEEKGTYYHQYRIKLKKGETINVYMNGFDAQAFVRMKDMKGNIVASADPESDDWYCDISYTAEKAGTYEIQAFQVHQGGNLNSNSYELRVTSDKAFCSPKVTSTDYGQIRLSWPKVKDADCYLIRKYKDKEKTKVIKKVYVNGNKYTDTSYEKNKVQYYTVTACSQTLSGILYNGESPVLTARPDIDFTAAAFSKLKLGSSRQTGTSITLKWDKLKKAEKYVIYANKCGQNAKPKKLATVKANTKTVRKVAGKKISKGTYYRFYVVALDKNKNIVSISKPVYVAAKGGNTGNFKSVTVKKKVLTKAKNLKKGESLKLNAKAITQSKSQRVKQYAAVRYASSNKKIARVTKTGVIRAKKKGTCYVYAYAQNGVYKKIKVVVK